MEKRNVLLVLLLLLSMGGLAIGVSPVAADSGSCYCYSCYDGCGYYWNYYYYWDYFNYYWNNYWYNYWYDYWYRW